MNPKLPNCGKAVTQHSVSSAGSDGMVLGSALDDYESREVLEGSGESAILCVPMYRCPMSLFGSEVFKYYKSILMEICT